jgi:hypothetical protein
VTPFDHVQHFIIVSKLLQAKRDAHEGSHFSPAQNRLSVYQKKLAANQKYS